MKILIVEDKESLSKALRDKFEIEKFEVTVVADGEFAFSIAKSIKPDIVLLDLVLPGKHGKEVLKELKKDEELKSIPVIVLSNLDTDSDIKEALRLGAEDYFVKVQHPIAEIIEKVKLVLLKSG